MRARTTPGRVVGVGAVRDGRVVRTTCAALIALAFVASDAATVQAQRGGGGRGRGGIQIMALTSPAFQDGGTIPVEYTQPGRDVSPPLVWTGAPDSTTSFVLIVHDADAAIGNGFDDVLHWMVWGIPGSVTSLPEGVPQGMQLPLSAIGAAPPASAAPAGGGRGGRGGGRGAGGGGGVRQISVSGPYYRGPAAPSTGNPHHYVFELYALDENVNVQPVGQGAGPTTRAAVVEAMQNHIRGKAVLVGMFRRAAP